jgi:hypothetical protein
VTRGPEDEKPAIVWSGSCRTLIEATSKFWARAAARQNTATAKRGMRVPSDGKTERRGKSLRAIMLEASRHSLRRHGTDHDSSTRQKVNVP